MGGTRAPYERSMNIEGVCSVNENNFVQTWAKAAFDER